MATKSKSDNSQLIGGLILIGLGVVFLLDKFWIWDLGYFVSRWWPLAMIAVGVGMLAQRGRRAGMGPMFLILLGAFFLAQRLDLIDWRMRDAWPALLIAMGLWMLAERGRMFGAAQPSDSK